MVSFLHPVFERLADGADDTDIRAAATEVPAHALLHLRLGELDLLPGEMCRHCARHAVPDLGQHSKGRADLSGCAVPALEAVVLDEGGLQRVYAVPTDAFDRHDLSAAILHGERETGVDTFAVDQHGTRAARAPVAALFVPVRPTWSRSASSRDTRGSSESSCVMPLTRNATASLPWAFLYLLCDVLMKISSLERCGLLLSQPPWWWPYSIRGVRGLHGAGVRRDLPHRGAQAARSGV
jgi:hypothetical protein